MRKEDQGLAFYQKTQNLRKMHKNRQNSVEFISDIRFNVGMDARQLKKEILAYILEFFVDDYSLSMMSGILDKNEEDITEAEKQRFNRVIKKMHDDAIAKV
tara:strand:- start:1322 stop:1624 length:303 start_codon:yes stop_codon:yes gene_type:complete